MSIPSSSLRSLLPDLSTALKSFQTSQSKFRVVRTISAPTKTQRPSPRTLLILDSSFNPPSLAHQEILTSAFHPDVLRNYTPPFQILLLFSTHNADKAPSAASFDQRLALMTIFAEDLLRNLSRTQSHPDSSSSPDVPSVDIGLTTAPYYTDKSAAIADSKTYSEDPKHVHLLGFDTITRFFAAKYYPDHHPPFSALAPYFDAGHRLRVTLRPTDEYGTVEEQRGFIDGIGEGKLEDEGARREWREQIEVVEAGSGVGVSSTRVRKAAKEGKWEEVEGLCTEGVARAVREEGIYGDDDRGGKMA